MTDTPKKKGRPPKPKEVEAELTTMALQENMVATNIYGGMFDGKQSI